MARLPTPGQDSGTWGSVLNDYLSVAHNTDGTLKTKYEHAFRVNLGDLDGARGDGSTDNTAVFQAAMDAVGAGSAVVFYLPPGVWMTDGLRVKSNVTIEGAGAGTFGLNSFDSTRVSVLKLIPNATRSLITDYGTGALSAGVSLRGIQFDGNKANQTNALSAIELFDAASGQDPLWRIERCYIHDCKGDGIKVGTFRRSLKLLDSEIKSCDGNGIVLNATDCTIRGCVIGQNGGDGIFITASLQHISDCDIFSNSNGISVGSFGFGVMILNCGIDINRRHGVTCAGPRMVIMGCNFQTNGTEANNTYSHIDLAFPTFTATGCAIMGVAMRHDSAVSPNKAKFGIQTNVPANVSGIAYNPSDVPWATGLNGNNAFMALAFRSQAFLDGVTLHMGWGGSGVKLGSAPTDKMGFYGATPVVRPSSTPAPATDPATTQALVNDIRAKLIALGLIS